MPVSLIVAYEKGTKLDIEYYTQHHIPMMMERFWKPYVRSWRVMKPMSSHSSSSSSFSSSFSSSSACSSSSASLLSAYPPPPDGKVTGGEEGSDTSPYVLMTITEFDSLEDLAEARVSLDEAGEKEIVESLRRCTDRIPVYWTVESWGGGRSV